MSTPKKQGVSYAAVQRPHTRRPQRMPETLPRHTVAPGSVFQCMERLRYEGVVSADALWRFGRSVGNRYFAIDLPPIFGEYVYGYLDLTKARHHLLFEAALECQTPPDKKILAFRADLPMIERGPTPILDPLLAAIVLERRVRTGGHSETSVLFSDEEQPRFHYLAARTISGAYSDEGCHALCLALLATNPLQPGLAVALLRGYIETGALAAACAA